MTFSDKLKLIRTTYQLTQSEFAKDIGISRANLVNIEKGRVVPTSLLINYISVAYGIDKNWLMNDDNLESTEIPSITTDITIDRIMFYYEQLNDEYRAFVLQQVKQLVELQQQVSHKKEES